MIKSEVVSQITRYIGMCKATFPSIWVYKYVRNNLYVMIIFKG